MYFCFPIKVSIPLNQQIAVSGAFARLAEHNADGEHSGNSSRSFDRTRTVSA